MLVLFLSLRLVLPEESRTIGRLRPGGQGARGTGVHPPAGGWTDASVAVLRRVGTEQSGGQEKRHAGLLLQAYATGSAVLISTGPPSLAGWRSPAGPGVLRIAPRSALRRRRQEGKKAKR